jgi:hypothetical protein
VTRQPPLTQEQLDAAMAAAKLIGHTGARSVEYGYQNDDAVGVADADWYASAQYRGTRVTVEHHIGPAEALEALAERLLIGGECQHCHGIITLEDGGARAYVGQRMLDGTIMTLERALTSPHCRYRRDGDRWRRGCEGLSRQQMRAQARAAAKRGRRLARR